MSPNIDLGRMIHNCLLKAHPSPLWCNNDFPEFFSTKKNWQEYIIMPEVAHQWHLDVSLMKLGLC
jgi:hypothetical protein